MRVGEWVRGRVGEGELQCSGLRLGGGEYCAVVGSEGGIGKNPFRKGINFDEPQL